MKRITVIAEDRKGLIADLSEELAQSGLNILSINARSLDGKAYLRLRIEPYDKALSLLRDKGYQAVSDDIIVLRIADQSGSLARIARSLAENDVDIRGVTMIQRADDFCIVAVATDNQALASEILQEQLLEI